MRTSLFMILVALGAAGCGQGGGKELFGGLPAAPYSEEALGQARANREPVVILATADW
jgi:hypothetical protein